MADNFNPMQWIADRDSEYAEKVRGLAPKGEGMLEGAGQYLANFAGMDAQRPPAMDNKGTPMNKAGLGAAVATRYALPAFGVTAAGIALADLAGYFGGSPDQPEQGQLGLNNGEMSALGVIAASPLVASGIGLGMDMFGGNEDIEQAAGQGRAQAAAMQAEMDAAYGQANSEANRAVAKAGRQRAARSRLPRSSRRR